MIDKQKLGDNILGYNRELGRSWIAPGGELYFDIYHGEHLRIWGVTYVKFKSTSIHVERLDQGWDCWFTGNSTGMLKKSLDPVTGKGREI